MHNKERIFQVNIIFKQKSYLEAAHFSDLNKSKKIIVSKYFSNGEKRGS